MCRLQKIPIVYFLIGLPGSGKTTWLKKNFKTPHVVSTDSYLYFLTITNKYLNFKDAFLNCDKEELLIKKQSMVNKFTKHNLNIIIDDWNLTKEDRDEIIIPSHYHKYAIIFDIHILNFQEWRRRLLLSDYNFLNEEEQFDIANKFSLPHSSENFKLTKRLF